MFRINHCPKNAGRFLKENGSIGCCAPSLGITISPYVERQANAIKKFNELGHKVVCSPSVYKMRQFASASAKRRAEEFMNMYADGNVDYIISAGDVYSMMKADENIFASIVGKAGKAVIYQHGSGITCTKWADIFGYCEKKEINRQISSGSHRESMFTILPGQIDNDTIGISLKREYRVLPEEINGMMADEAYILDAVSNELAYTKII